MKARLIAVVLGILLLVGAILYYQGHTRSRNGIVSVEVPRSQLVQSNGHWYQVGQTNFFTGVLVDKYPNGLLLARSQISNGLLNGLSETWYTNRQLQVRENFKDGISDGLREKWHEN